MSGPLTLTIMRPGAQDETREVDATDYRALRPLLVELLEGGDPEHVSVLHHGQRADMFVDGDGAGVLPRNEVATTVYRNNWLTQHPGTAPETLPAVYGLAVLTSRRVWF